MSWHTNTKGQATLEAAFAIPVVFALLLLLVQPGIILYDRMIMRQAAAEACRLLATRSAASFLDDQHCIDLIKRHLAAIPPHDLFHIHNSGCTWDITVSGDEGSSQVCVHIENKIRLLPLFDTTMALVGIADSSGCFTIRIEEHAPVQPVWVYGGSAGNSPQAWVSERG